MTRQTRKRRSLMGPFLLLLLGVSLLVMWLQSPERKAKRAEKYGCPEEILEFTEKYPQASAFAENYAKYRDYDEPIDISGELEKGKIPLFLQWDYRWGYRTYGNKYMGLNGCGPTCLAMVYCGLTGDASVNPHTMAVWANDHGYYVPDAGTTRGLMSDGAEQFGLSVTETGTDEEQIRDALNQAHPVICIVGPGDFTVGGHFIVLSGINGDGTVRVNDPNSEENSEKDWELSRIVSQTNTSWAYCY